MISLKDIVEKIELTRHMALKMVANPDHIQIRVYLTHDAYKLLRSIEGAVPFELIDTVSGAVRKINGCPVYVLTNDYVHPMFSVSVSFSGDANV